MVEFGDEHCGNAIEGSASFLVDAGQHDQWVELLHHYFCAAVCQTVHGGQHHAKAMEQGHADA